MDTKHTPGPWEAHQGVLKDAPTTWDVTSRHDWSGIGDETPQGWFVATVHEVTDAASAKANAHLIAAAPDMLAALESLLNHYVELVNCGDCGFWNPEEESEVIAARAAIAKARSK